MLWPRTSLLPPNKCEFLLNFSGPWPTANCWYSVSVFVISMCLSLCSSTLMIVIMSDQQASLYVNSQIEFGEEIRPENQRFYLDDPENLVIFVPLAKIQAKDPHPERFDALTIWSDEGLRGPCFCPPVTGEWRTLTRPNPLEENTQRLKHQHCCVVFETNFRVFFILLTSFWN